MYFFWEVWLLICFKPMVCYRRIIFVYSLFTRWGSFFDKVQAQIEVRTLGPVVMIWRDWAWFTAVKWLFYKPSDAQSKILQEIHASVQEYFRTAKAKAKKKESRKCNSRGHDLMLEVLKLILNISLSFPNYKLQNAH